MMKPAAAPAALAQTVARVLIISTLCCGAGAVLAGGPAVWKWLDANRRVHISDLPPPANVPDRDILQRPDGSKPAETAAAAAAPAPQNDAASAAKPDPEFEARLRKAKAKAAPASPVTTEPTLTPEQREQRAENCKLARNHLTALESGIRVRRMNDKGESEFMDDAARERDTQRTRKIIAADCT